MKIEGLSAAFPSRVVTNEEILHLIGQESHLNNDVSRLMKPIGRTLRISGSNTRRWLGENESPLGLTVKACKKAMSNLGEDNKIDFLIYASVYPLIMEPASANVVCCELGLNNTEGLDIKEACDGWEKAVKIAYALIKIGMYRRIMIVNTEFVMRPGFGIYPNLFNMSSPDQLEWRFPAFTLGEVATAMILGPEEDEGWAFTNTTRNDLFDRCTITMPWYEKEQLLYPRVAKDGAGCFTSYGAELRHHGFPLAVEEFKKSGANPREVDALFTHSSCLKDWSEVAEIVGLTEQFHDIYATRGNVVSAAVPAAMALAVEEGRLNRGDRVVALVASAGMSFSTASFTF